MEPVPSLVLPDCFLKLGMWLVLKKLLLSMKLVAYVCVCAVCVHPHAGL